MKGESLGNMKELCINDLTKLFFLNEVLLNQTGTQ